MRAKLVKESYNDIPENVSNLILDVALHINKELGINAKVSDIRFNKLSFNYQGIIKNVDDITVDQMNQLIDIPFDYYSENEADNISIVYDRDEHAISIYVKETISQNIEVEDKINALAKQVENVLDVELILQFDEELQDPKSFDKDENSMGIYYNVIDNKHDITIDDELILHISNDGNFQFWNDATPLSTNLHSKTEKFEMMSALWDNPKPITKLTKTVYQSIINYIIKNKNENEY